MNTSKTVKCARCLNLADTQRRIINVTEQIEIFQSRRYNTDFLENGLFALYNTREDLIVADCDCMTLTQGVLPISNTGVKNGAFSEGIAQRR